MGLNCCTETRSYLGLVQVEQGDEYCIFNMPNWVLWPRRDATNSQGLPLGGCVRRILELGNLHVRDGLYWRSAMLTILNI